MNFHVHQFHSLPGVVADGQEDTRWRAAACCRRAPLFFSSGGAEQSREFGEEAPRPVGEAAPVFSAVNGLAAGMQEVDRAPENAPGVLFRFFVLAFVGGPVVAALACWLVSFLHRR